MQRLRPFFLFFALLSVAQSAIVWVGNNGSTNDTCGSTQNAPCKTIAAAYEVIKIGDTIRLLPGRYVGLGASPLEIRYDNVTIDSLNGVDSVVIDLKGQVGFDLPELGSHLILRGLTLTNGTAVCYNAQGSNVTIDGCVITHSGGPDASPFEIQLGSWLIINNSRFENNQAVTGGVVNMQSGFANVTNSIFFNNSASQSGGAISISEGVLNIINSTFESNRAIDGGAIDVDAQDSIVNVNFTTFIDNVAGAGGAVEFSSNSYGSFANCSFTGNMALEHGGAMFLDQRSGCSVLNSSFVENHATGRGGAIYFTTEATFILGTSVFTNNVGGSFGGGFYLSEGGTLQAWNVIFDGNVAPYGGGLYTEYRSFVYLTFCEFNMNSANESGGGIYCSDSRLKLNGTEFHGNFGPQNKDPNLYCSTFPGYTSCHVTGTNSNYNEQCGDHSSESSQDKPPFPVLAIVGIVLLSLAGLLVTSMIATCVWWRIRNRSQIGKKSIVLEEDQNLLSNFDE
eukprot:TRINITY_DN32_c1_g1_i1.p1 TRINITY_DN32_c1_g1~~TRINITY_DN32_c1_g1_i1.p1  ORF type:complete len:509 (-),score=176.99 TRINITY_DN32_c1_g1_i1:25-1551(-)